MGTVATEFDLEIMCVCSTNLYRTFIIFIRFVKIMCFHTGGNSGRVLKGVGESILFIYAPP